MQANAISAIDKQKDQHEFQQVKPGQFNQSENSDTVFYMEALSDDRLELQEVIIGQTSPDTMILETARSGKQKIDEETGDLFLVVGPGQRIEGTAGRKDFKIIDYEQHGILIENKSSTGDERVRSVEKSVEQLWASSLISDRVELQWRIAIPLVLFTLAMIAVPLSYISPRQGRFGKVGYALLVFIVYLNLLGFTRAQLEAANLPMVINFWWVHLLFGSFAVFLLYRRNKGVLFFRSGARL
jgi:lipopolysaccharide export system permease protein